MSTTFSCTVDTTPMASEMQSVSTHVKGTTAAVVTMQSAVIMAENNSANKVCSNVNRGFFMLVRSQISQKIANKQSRVEALLIQLAQQKRRLLGIKNNMEREYGRIAERYLRTFTAINKELEVRIRQLDQPVFELVNHQMATSSNRMNALTAIIPTQSISPWEKTESSLSWAWPCRRGAIIPAPPKHSKRQCSACWENKKAGRGEPWSTSPCF